MVYAFVRSLMEFSLSFSYRNIILTGYDKVKYRKPILFVSNHQNTFMDGLVLINAARNISPNILVRADIFKSKWAALALDIIRLIPIYRKKDNMGSVAQNNEIFKKCVDLFKKGEPLLIFPEGNHAIKRFLRPLQKGPARIAFQAEEENNFHLDLHVAPFGIHYENHPKRWYDLHVHFGDAFMVKDFQSTFEENPTKAQKQFTDKIREEISDEMIDIQWHEEYEFMERVRTLLKPYALNWVENAKSIVQAENVIIDRITNQLQENEEKTAFLKNRIEAYFNEVKNCKLSEDFLAARPNLFGLFLKAIGVLIGLPFWLLAKVINFIPEYFIEKKVIARVKDITWHISLRAGIALFLYPLYYLFILIAFGFSFNWILAGIIVCSFPLLSVVMLETEYHFKKLKNAVFILKSPDVLEKERDLVQRLREFALDEKGSNSSN